MVSETRDLIHQIFNETLQEYQTWSTKLFRFSVKSIQRRKSVQGSTEVPIEDDPPSIPPPLLAVSQAFVEVTDFGEGGMELTGRVPLLRKETSNSVKSISPHPPYESVTPIERSLFYQNEGSTLAFVPFSDDPSFPRNKIIGLIDSYYSSLAWEKIKYPEVDVIVLEAVRRLRERGMSLETIEESRILPRRIGDLTKNNTNRDVPGCFQHKTSFRSPILSPDIKSLTGTFCDNMNCNVSICSSHDPDWLGILPLPPAPTVKSSDLLTYRLSREPCDNTCFMSKKNSSPSLSDWTARDLELLELILEREPDAGPCDLAVVMHKPCCEVFAQRKILLPDPPGRSESPTKRRRFRRQKNAHGHIKGEVSSLVHGGWENPYRPDLDFVTVAFDFVALRPCRHVGPCEPGVCECADRELRCERRCRCDPDCVRRHRGCECRLITGKVCDTDGCACYHERRECDPQLCTHCGAGKLGLAKESNKHRTLVSMSCCGSGLQHKPNAFHRKFEVRESQYGLGLFTLLSIKPEEIVTEYTGEIIQEETVELRIFLARLRQRNYVMMLAKDTELDAGPAGSIARYINHGKPDEINIRAEVYLVNGEHRIGLFSTRHINAGEELLMNYGDEYFTEIHSRVPSTTRGGPGVIHTSSVSIVR